MRRLPIFFMIDVSESMAGQAIQEVQSGIQTLLNALMSDPFAMETVYISVITFAGKAKLTVPLTYILDFEVPKLSIGSGTNLTNALTLLMSEIDTNVRKNTPEVKGDWKPLIFLLTDGAPSDDYRGAVQQWKQKYGKYSLVAVLMGENSNASALQSLTDKILVFKDATAESYQAFFKWVSSSIQTSSKEIGENGKEAQCDLARIKANIDKDLLAEELPRQDLTEYFVLTVRCQKTKQPYIIRFIKKAGMKKFMIDGTFPVDESYFELLGDSLARDMDAELFAPTALCCPYCNNKKLGRAECDNWICIDDDHLNDVECPWCGNISDYGGTVRKISGGQG